MKSILYLYNKEHEEFIESVKKLDMADAITFVSYVSDDELESVELSEAKHLITTGTMVEIKKIIRLALRYNIGIGIVPLSTQLKLIKMFSLPKKTEDAFRLAMSLPEQSIDLLYCNDTIVLNDVRIGNTVILKEFEYDYMSESIWVRMRHFWESWRQKEPLKHYRFTVKTDKDAEKSFSAVGLIGIDCDNGSWVASVLKSHLGLVDGQHMLVILSPVSLFQFYVAQPLVLLFGNSKKQKLPRSLGFVKSSEIAIECHELPEVLIDDKELAQMPIRLRTEEAILKLSTGDEFWASDKANGRSERNSIRLDNVPQDEESMEYLAKGLPLFQHASKEQYTSLFTSLRGDAVLSSVFMVLLILASTIATLGLFINSSSVIIGAMLLAPLMQPIVSLSMAVLRQDSSMQSNAIKTIAIGVFAVVMTATVISLFVPIERLTSEMSSRLSPTLLDLFVAIASGVAAAYAKNNEKILSSLAGVAIAVALVPPLAVAGVGLGWAKWAMFSSAFLLFITNLVGIVLAASMTFMIMGYSPIKIARKGIATWLLIVMLVAIPLYGSFKHMQENVRIRNILTNTHYIVDEKRLELAHIEILRHKGKPEIRCEVISSGVLTDTDKAYLKNIITKSIGKEVEIIATFRYRL
ncbi:MAG: DUF389 domain-containing protein [Sulfurovum sp.]|nr:DUF389 domain-containing protein [Sulfurovum sp.]